MSRVFFRVTRSNPPTALDFTSNFTIGRGLANPTPERVHLWRGISVFDSEELARKKARTVPQIGGYIVRLEVGDNSGIVSMPTFGKGHYTLWGAVEHIARCWVPPACDV